jgi:hypothetical protein
MFKATMVALIVLCSSISVQAQFVDSVWTKKYSGPGSTDRATDIAVDNSGNIIVTGYSWGGISLYDIVTIKYAPGGDSLWMANYNSVSNGDDLGNVLAIDNAGYIYISGESDGDIVTIKYTPTGDTSWVRTYNGPGAGTDIAYDIALDAAGNSYICGRSAGSGTGDDFVTIKYDSLGTQQWASRYSGPVVAGSDDGKAIAVDNLGNVYAVGESAGFGTDDDYILIKYNSLGAQQWVLVSCPMNVLHNYY